MKAILFSTLLVLVLSLAAQGQTNELTRRSPKEVLEQARELTKPFSVATNGETIFLPPFTNSAGIWMSNTVYQRTFADGVLYARGATMGKVPWSALSEEWREKLGYDSTREMVAADVAALKKTSAEAAELKRLLSERWRREMESIEATAVPIRGRVLQNVPGGLLISGLPRLNEEGYGPIVLYDGIAFLATEKAKADGAPMNVLAYPDGLHSYTTVSGGSRTVTRFELSPMTVFRRRFEANNGVDFDQWLASLKEKLNGKEKPR